MTLNLELPPDLERALSVEAKCMGLPLSEYALRLLAFRPNMLGLPKNGAELVAYWQREGVTGSRPDIVDSQAHTRQLRQQAERRVRE